MKIFKINEQKVDLEDAKENLKSAILSYIPFVNLIPYFKKTDSLFVEFHAKEGITLFIIEILYTILSLIFTRIKVVTCSWGICVKQTPIYIIVPLNYLFLHLIIGLFTLK